MTTIEIAKKELKFTLDNLEDLYLEYEPLKENPLYLKSCPETGYGIMMSVIFYQTWIEEIKNLDQYFAESFKTIKNQVDIFLTKEEKLNFAIKQAKILQKKLQKNNWNHLIPLKKFSLITNMFFMDKVHKTLFENFDSKFESFRKECYPQQWEHTSLVHKYQQIVNEDFFHEFSDLLKILVDVKMIHILRYQLSKIPEKITKPHYYPLVFNNEKCYEFFHYCMKAYQKSDLSKTLLSKYFEFFKHDGFILEEVKKKNFFSFIQRELQVEMKRLEPYTSSEASEKEEYNSMKNSFFTKQNP